MATYEIKSYIKLLCIRIDHFESYIVDEVNTTDGDMIERFIEKYNDRPGLKIIMIKMNDDMEMITFDDVKKILHNAHFFDYLRSIISEDNKVLPVHDIDGIDMNWLVKYMLPEK